MKRHILYTLIFSLGLLCSCTTEKDLEKTAPPTGIELSYTRAGVPVEDISLNAMGQKVVVDVELNNDDLFWNIESDAEWCTVLEQQHRGSGSFTLNISANEDFSPREPAVITFVSGQYRSLAFHVSQSGNVFIIDKPYMVKSKTAGTAELEVSVQEGTEWDFTNDQWLTVTRGEESAGNGMVTTKLSIEWAENADPSRFGVINFIRSGYSEPETQASIYQFGSEYAYDSEGFIVLPAETSESFRIMAPTYYISDIDLPEWISYTVIDGENNISTYNFTTADNPSDTKSARDVNIVLEINGVEESISIPTMKQDFYIVSGIVSANGLKMFAEAFNAQEDTTPWMKDGKVVLLRNIDMNELDGEWVSIGTAETPFNGTFDGAYRKIMGLKSTEPLFGVCNSATISNIIVDERCEISVVDGYMQERNVAAIVGEAKDCTISECESYASVTMSASTTSNESNAYVAAIVAKALGETKLIKCRNYGNVTATDDSNTATSQGNFHVAGVVALNEGTAEGCENSGSVSDNAVSYRHYVGGIVATNNGLVNASLNTGEVKTGAVRLVNSVNDASRYIDMGGIAGYSNGELNSNVNNGEVISTSDVKIQRIGGISGELAGGSKVSANANGENSRFEVSGGVRILSLGGLYGEVTFNSVFDYTAETDVKLAVINIKKHESSATAYIHVGGLIGRCSADHTLTVKSPKVDIACTMSAGLKANIAATAVGLGGVVGTVGENVTDSYEGGLLTVTDALCTGRIAVDASTKYTQKYTTFGAGGVVGFVSLGGADISGCESKIKIEEAVITARSNGAGHYVGGIAGYIARGASSIVNCTNSGDIDFKQYNNNNWNGASDRTNGIAGIIGAYGYKYALEEGDGITVTGCTNTARVVSYRGMAGGIAGYLANAAVSNCSSSGSMTDTERSFLGGIAAIVQNSTIENCTAKCNIGGKKSGSASFRAGGIIGIMESSACRNNSYYGRITAMTSDASDIAGILVGTADSDSSVESSKAGGTLLGINMTADNISGYFVGSGPEAVNCSYWNGK